MPCRSTSVDRGSGTIALRALHMRGTAHRAQHLVQHSIGCRAHLAWPAERLNRIRLERFYISSCSHLAWLMHTLAFGRFGIRCGGCWFGK